MYKFRKKREVGLYKMELLRSITPQSIFTLPPLPVYKILSFSSMSKLELIILIIQRYVLLEYNPNFYTKKLKKIRFLCQIIKKKAF